MWRNKKELQFLLVIGLLGVLSACSEGTGATNSSARVPESQIKWSSILWAHAGLMDKTIPDSQVEAQAWLHDEWQKAQSSRKEAQANRLGEQLQNADRRLMRTIAPMAGDAEGVARAESGTEGAVTTNTPVFIALNRSAETKTAQHQANQQLQERLTQTTHRLLDDLDAMARPTAAQLAPQPMASSMPDLSQAERQQIKYLGLMSVGAEQFGLIRVGERVYRVTPNMQIGRGQWRIIRMDATNMQLLINGQTVNYGK